jgi:hypothetical protein
MLDERVPGPVPRARRDITTSARRTRNIRQQSFAVP